MSPMCGTEGTAPIFGERYHRSVAKNQPLTTLSLTDVTGLLFKKFLKYLYKYIIEL